VKFFGSGNFVIADQAHRDSFLLESREPSPTTQVGHGVR
jgi:hypothetical protein